MTDDDGYGEGFEDEDDRPARRFRNWRSLRPPMDERKQAALARSMRMDRMLDHHYLQRGVSDIDIVQNRGLEGHKFVGIPDHEDDLYLADIGRFIAAMGGYLELRAVFPDQTVTILAEPGPEHL